MCQMVEPNLLNTLQLEKTLARTEQPCRHGESTRSDEDGERHSPATRVGTATQQDAERSSRRRGRTPPPPNTGQDAVHPHKSPPEALDHTRAPPAMVHSEQLT